MLEKELFLPRVKFGTKKVPVWMEGVDAASLVFTQDDVMSAVGGTFPPCSLFTNQPHHLFAPSDRQQLRERWICFPRRPMTMPWRATVYAPHC